MYVPPLHSLCCSLSYVCFFSFSGFVFCGFGRFTFVLCVKIFIYLFRHSSIVVDVKPCSRLSTARGPCLCNIPCIQANWFKQYHAHKKPVRPWPFDIWPWYSIGRGCQDTCLSRISSSYVQRFMSYRVNRERKKTDDAENNTAVVSVGSNYPFYYSICMSPNFMKAKAKDLEHHRWLFST